MKLLERTAWFLGGMVAMCVALYVAIALGAHVGAVTIDLW